MVVGGGRGRGGPGKTVGNVMPGRVQNKPMGGDSVDRWIATVRRDLQSEQQAGAPNGIHGAGSIRE